MPTRAQLLTEINTGPLAEELAALMQNAKDWDVARILNDSTRGLTLARPMRVGDFANWLASRGLLRRIESAKTHASEVIASIALLLMYKIQGDPSRLVDPNSSEIQGMFAAYEAAGISAAQDRQDFIAACTSPASRAEVLWGDGVEVTAEQVGACR